MRYLYTLDELLALASNGYSCAECGRTWLDAAGPGFAFPVTDGIDPACKHPKLTRAMVAA
jgi:hypothetical protein